MGAKARPGLVRASSGDTYITKNSALGGPSVFVPDGVPVDEDGHVIKADVGGTVDRFNPVIDDLSRGSVVEDWIPRDLRGQNRLFRMMYSRGIIEGPAVETIAELVWSDFDFTDIADPKVLDVFYASKESTHVDRYLPDITKEMLPMGRVAIQLFLDEELGIWTDMSVVDSDYLKVTPIPRVGCMPMLDLLPSPEMQTWARSRDPRAIESRRGLSDALIKQLGSSQTIPLDPLVTAYLPRRLYFNDMIGTSYFVRLIQLWAVEKSLINATVTGHRRRAGPITHIKAGSETWKPTTDEAQALLDTVCAADEDSVSAVILTNPDVSLEMFRGGGSDLWKWEDSWAWLQEAKLRGLGFSEALLSGDATIQHLEQSMTLFNERMKAHRNYVTEHFLIGKFCRSLALVNGFKKRTTAELTHRVRVKRYGEEAEHELLLPKIRFRKLLEPQGDQSRLELLNTLRENGVPISLRDWTAATGYGDPLTKLAEMREDLRTRAKLARVSFLQNKINALTADGGSVSDNDELMQQLAEIEQEIEKLPFGEEDGVRGADSDADSHEDATKDGDDQPKPPPSSDDELTEPPGDGKKPKVDDGVVAPTDEQKRTRPGREAEEAQKMPKSLDSDIGKGDGKPIPTRPPARNPTTTKK